MTPSMMISLSLMIWTGLGVMPIRPWSASWAGALALGAARDAAVKRPMAVTAVRMAIMHAPRAFLCRRPDGERGPRGRTRGLMCVVR